MKAERFHGCIGDGKLFGISGISPHSRVFGEGGRSAGIGDNLGGDGGTRGIMFDKGLGRATCIGGDRVTLPELKECSTTTNRTGLERSCPDAIDVNYHARAGMIDEREHIFAGRPRDCLGVDGIAGGHSV